MQNDLRLYHTIIGQIRKWLPDERITRVRNLALLLTGLYLGRKVHLSLIAEEWHLPGKTPVWSTVCGASWAIPGYPFATITDRSRNRWSAPFVVCRFG